MPRKKKSVSHYDRNPEESFALCKKLIDLEATIRKATVEFAGIAVEAYAKEAWKDFLGDEQAEWKAFLSTPEVFRTRAEVNNWMMFYDKLVNRFGFNAEDMVAISIKKLIRIAKLSDASNVADDLVAKASTLISQDWNSEVAKLEDKVTPDECKHPDGLIKEERCKKCGYKHKLDEEHEDGA